MQKHTKILEEIYGLLKTTRVLEENIARMFTNNIDTKEDKKEVNLDDISLAEFLNNGVDIINEVNIRINDCIFQLKELNVLEETVAPRNEII